MTTRVMVTNFGPDQVEIKRSNAILTEVLYPSQYKEYYVHDTQQITVKEKKAVAPDVK